MDERLAMYYTCDVPAVGGAGKACACRESVSHEKMLRNAHRGLEQLNAS